MGNSDYLRDLALKRTLLDASVFAHLFVALHQVDPGDEGVGEVDGGGYRRQEVDLTRLGSGTAANANVIEYDDMPRAHVGYFGIWDAREGGNFLTGGILLVPHEVVAGQALRWRERELLLRVG